MSPSPSGALKSLYDLVGLRFAVEDEDGQPDVGLVTGVAGWSPQYVLVETSDGQTCRLGAHLLRHLDPVTPTTTDRRATVPAATAKKSPAKPATRKSPAKKGSGGTAKAPPAEKPAAKKGAKKAAEWKALPDAELAAHLLAHQTLPDRSWEDRAGGATREKGEKRDAFIRRVLLGETPETEAASS